MNKERERLTNAEAWTRTMRSLRQHREVIGKQLPKALEDYPELVGSLIWTVGYLAHQINMAREYRSAGVEFDLPDSEDLLDICNWDPLCKCFEDFRWTCFFDELPVLDVLEWGGFVLPPSCETLISEYYSAQECLPGLRREDYSTLAAYVAAVTACIDGEEQAKQAVLDNGCWCEYLEQELIAAQVEGAEDEVQEFLSEMTAAGCLE